MSRPGGLMLNAEGERTDKVPTRAFPVKVLHCTTRHASFHLGNTSERFRSCYIKTPSPPSPDPCSWSLFPSLGLSSS